MVVLDASVILKWIFHDENGSAKARRFKDAHVAGDEIIAVPDLLFYEVANVLATKTQLDNKYCVEVFSILWEFGLERFDFGAEEFISALSMARRHSMSVYDAAYIELSRRLRCPFITADRRLYERAKGLGAIQLL
jgi:predicted nucleic acid-binding protein